MYQYDAHDQQLVDERVVQLRDQLARHRAGELSADALRPLRLLNGLYIERQGPMLRIAIPYGLLASRQLRALARVARTYARGVGHFTTRHNLQLNGLSLDDAPAILEELARVQLHAIQTSGSCVRNVTCDPLAGVAPDESVDPRPWCELLRQWSAGHPEFAALPRKLKIAVQGARTDRALIRVHDIGLAAVRDPTGEIGFQVYVGGGLGRAPLLAQGLIDFVSWRHLLSYCEAICRVFNRDGRRDNPYRSRLKFLVETLGIEEFRRRVEAEWEPIKDGPLTLSQAQVDRVARHFADQPDPDGSVVEATANDPDHNRDHNRDHQGRLARNPRFAAWVRRNVRPHRRPGYAIVTVSTKRPDNAPGDVSADQMEQIARWADAYSRGEVRITQRQNLVLPDVCQADLFALWGEAADAGLADANIGLLTDICACPGGDWCSLANARSIPLANAIQSRFADPDLLDRVGELTLNLSGCVNACAHHPIAHIGIRGIDKRGAEYYQIGIGGTQGSDPRFGTVIGPAFPAADVPAALDRLLSTYLAYRLADEPFIDTVRRIGVAPFRAAAYGSGEPNRSVAQADDSVQAAVA